MNQEKHRWRDRQGKKRYFLVVLATFTTAFLFSICIVLVVRWWGGWLMGRCSHDDEVAGICGQGIFYTNLEH